jgi:hypothetical protein
MRLCKARIASSTAVEVNLRSARAGRAWGSSGTGDEPAFVPALPASAFAVPVCIAAIAPAPAKNARRVGKLFIVLRLSLESARSPQASSRGFIYLG